MNLRVFLLAIGWLVAVGACAAPLTGTSPKDASLDMTGTFMLSSNGELQLSLAKACTMEKRVLATGAVLDVGCSRERLDEIQIIAHTPWNQDIRGTWSDGAHITFRVDWKHSGLDPLADDAATIVTLPWAISGTLWSPSSEEAATILKLIGDATEVETELIRGGPAPSLNVTTFEVDGGALHTGAPSTLVVRIANRGRGTAYRVVATTRSSIDALRGQRLSFGAIKPGADKVRRLPLTVPVSVAVPDAMMVLVITEGNGFAPENVSRRLPIKPSMAAPKLAVSCVIIGHEGPRPELDAGGNEILHCAVENTGDAGSKVVDLETSVAGSTPVRSQTQAIAVAGHASYDVPITILRELPIGSPVEVAITAHDRQYSRTAQTKLIGVVRKPKLCEVGKLTQAQYDAKLKALRSAVAAGDLTQAQLDRYDAELVTCLK